MAHLPRWTRSGRQRLLFAPALGLAAALAAAGCTSAPAGPAATGTAATASTASGAAGTAAGRAGAPAGPAITETQARRVFAAYVAATARAARSHSQRPLLPDVTGVQRTVLAAALASHSAVIAGTPSSSAYSSTLTITPGYRPPSYGAPVFYLPEAAGYPRFFVAQATQTVPGTPSSSHPSTLVGGAAVPADGTALLLFEQQSAGAPWLLASSSDLAAGAAQPRLATDSAGYIPVVSPSAAALPAQPDSVGALAAAVVDDGAASAASRVVAAGPLTTGMYAGARNHADGLRAPDGDVYQWELEGSDLPEFALRTADGGALVFYAMSLDETVAVPGYLAKADPVDSGPPIQVPDDLLPLLPKGQSAPLVQLSSVQTLSFAATDPAAASGKIAVIAVGGGLTSASAT